MTPLFLLVALVGAPCEELRLDATVHASLRSISGIVECVRPTVPISEIEIWNYPARLGNGEGTPENEVPWTYPEGYSPTAMQVRVNGGPSLPLDVRTPLQALESVESLKFHFETLIPNKNGSFAFRSGSLFLAGGWFPRLIDKAQKEHRPIPISYTIHLPKPLAGSVGTQPVHGQSKVANRFTGTDLPIVLGTNVQAFTSSEAIILFPRKRRLRDSRLPLHLRDATSGRDSRAIEELRETLRRGRAFASALELPTPPLLVSIAPLRQHLIEPTQVGFFISDRAFHLWDYEPFLKFHRLQVWQYQLEYYVAQFFGSREAGPFREQNLQFLSAALLDKLLFETYGKSEDAVDMLEPFAIIPEIETLVYAPQIPFRTTYYKAIYDEANPLNLPHQFHSSLNSGSLLYDKLVDKVGRSKAQRLLQEFLSQNNSWTNFLTDSLDHETTAFLEGWREGYPRVDYRISIQETTPSHTVIRVDADGPDRATLREPLKVSLEDPSGSVHSQTRTGPGDLKFSGVSNPTQIQLDPGRRLVELHREPGKDPHYNNRVVPQLNFLLNSISGLFSLTDAGLSLGVNFSLRRNYDLRWKHNFAGFYSPSAYGIAVGTSYAFGQQLTPLWLSSRVRLGLNLNHLREETGDSPAGTQGSVGLAYRYDTRSNAFSSFRGEGISARLVGAYTETETDQTYEFLQASLSGLYLWQLGATQALAARLRGDVTFGISPPQNGFRLGGRSLGGRGYEMNQFRGRRRVVATLEHRHALVSGMRTDVAGLFTLTRIEGAFFADGIYLDQEDAFRFPKSTASCGNELFADAGYGLRFLVDLMNISPASLTVDVGTPLTRCGSVQDESPVAVYISFVQSLLAF